MYLYSYIKFRIRFQTKSITEENIDKCQIKTNERLISIWIIAGIPCLFLKSIYLDNSTRKGIN